MHRIGILAYGSLLHDPGKELASIICEKIEGVETPFPVEFARSSSSRDGAPTLIPYKRGGKVRGSILVLDPALEVALVKNLLWRRETRNECSDKQYQPTGRPGQNKVIVNICTEFAGVETVLYTTIGSNIKKLTADYLADLALCSAIRTAGDNKKDGIHYLILAKKFQIETPLMPAYEAAILRKTKTKSLEEAYKKIRKALY